MLKEKLRQDLKEALKEKREVEVSTLRLVLAAIFNREKEKRYKISKKEPDLTEDELIKKSQLTDEEIIELLFSEVKKRREAILEFEKGKREDLVQQSKKEIEILQKYLPKQLSEAEIKKEAMAVIEEIGAKALKDMGRVMANLMPKLKGKAEGSIVSKIVKDLLSVRREKDI